MLSLVSTLVARLLFLGILEKGRVTYSTNNKRIQQDIQFKWKLTSPCREARTSRTDGSFGSTPGSCSRGLQSAIQIDLHQSNEVNDWKTTILTKAVPTLEVRSQSFGHSKLGSFATVLPLA